MQAPRTPADWVPFEWPAAWDSPARLSLLEAGPWNAIVFRGPPPAGVREAAGRAGFACPEPAWKPFKEIDWSNPGALAAVGDALWPQVSGSGAAATAGPTGGPWIDANGWLIELARRRAPATPIWLRSEPPTEPETLPGSAYRLAWAEAAAFGARRPVWLAPQFAAALAGGNPASAEEWKRLRAAVAWFEQRRDWWKLEAVAPLLVVSRFAGAEEYLAGEVLNLGARRGLPATPCEEARFSGQVLAGKAGAIWMERQPPNATAAALLKDFAAAGGALFLLPTAAGGLESGPPVDDTHPRFRVYALGKGRLAVARDNWDDPWLLAGDLHVLMSRRHDELLLFNAASIMWRHTRSADGKTSVVHLINYALRAPAHQVSLQLRRPVRRARLLSWESEQLRELTLNRESGRQEIHLPPLAVYSAVQLEG
jgi:hypothetical protein